MKQHLLNADPHRRPKPEPTKDEGNFFDVLYPSRWGNDDWLMLLGVSAMLLVVALVALRFG